MIQTLSIVHAKLFYSNDDVFKNRMELTGADYCSTKVKNRRTINRYFIFMVLLFWGYTTDAQVTSQDILLSVQAQAPFSEIPQLHFTLCYKNQTAHSYHERYEIRYNNIPVLDRYITLHFDQHHRLLGIDEEMNGLEKLKYYNPNPELEIWKGILPEEVLSKNEQFIRHLKSHSLKIYMDNGYPQLVLEAKAWCKTYDRSILVNAIGDMLREVNYERNYSDTTIHAKIFNPDPLTIVQQNYGGVYVDSNDLHQGWMTSAYQTVDIPAHYSVDSFYLENDLVKLDEFEEPVVYPAVQSTADFYFHRGQSGFEDVNVLYHLTHFHDYISSLGYDSLMAMGVSVDAHAQFGADNSVFSRNGGNPTLRFGTGGVDDAEDADVIIHEYAHGLSWSANGNDNFSNERAALDEGVADYFATSYSRNISNYHWEKLFNWDGQNEFWGGRKANSTTNYPIAAGLYTIGEIWNSAMSALWGDLGATITDKLMLESLHFFSNATTLPQAAIYVLQADSLLFGGQYHSIICQRFQERNILDVLCQPVAVSSSILDKDILVRNTKAFAEGLGDAIIDVKDHASGHCFLYNMQGQCIRKISFQKQIQIRIPPDGLAPGLYTMVLTWNNNIYRSKLSRY